jgi:hypothetical protein
LMNYVIQYNRLIYRTWWANFTYNEYINITMNNVHHPNNEYCISCRIINASTDTHYHLSYQLSCGSS